MCIRGEGSRMKEKGIERRKDKDKFSKEKKGESKCVVLCNFIIFLGILHCYLNSHATQLHFRRIHTYMHTYNDKTQPLKKRKRKIIPIWPNSSKIVHAKFKWKRKKSTSVLRKKRRKKRKRRWKKRRPSHMIAS